MFTQKVEALLWPIFAAHGYRRMAVDGATGYTRSFAGGWQTAVIFRPLPTGEHAPESAPSSQAGYFVIELLRTRRDASGETLNDPDSASILLSNGSAGEVEARDSQDGTWAAPDHSELSEQLNFARWKLERYALPWLELKLVPL